ncbi:MAG: acetyl-CoA acetyltransferase [Chloroflexi bacterium]|nr:acetyl-CoA acetyltransferase [Chloroflexota bacterium]
MPWSMRDKTCIVGIGETEYTPWGQQRRSEFQLACEATLKACEDAGLPVEQVDGICGYSDDRNNGCRIATALGIPQLRFNNMFWGGGGGGAAGNVGNAMMAVYSGMANYVIAFRALAQGQFSRFGQSGAGPRVQGDGAHSAPFALMNPVHNYALQTRRHMHEYGTTEDHLCNISLASYKHAQRNPRAVMYGRPLTRELYHKSRYISEPLHLYDCCQETDGSAAVLVTTPERARDLKQRPVYLMAAAQGTGPRQGAFAGNKPNFATANFSETARDLWARAGIEPKDVQVAQVYENMTGMVLMSIEDHGFCKRGEGGPFTEGGRLEHKDVAEKGAPNAGKLPINTSGGNLAEAYTHGLELVNEAVRQMRGTSTCQVEGAEICLVAAGPGVAPVSDLIVRR